jgi:hypothetical protein
MSWQKGCEAAYGDNFYEPEKNILKVLINKRL